MWISVDNGGQCKSGYHNFNIMCMNMYNYVYNFIHCRNSSKYRKIKRYMFIKKNKCGNSHGYSTSYPQVIHNLWIILRKPN